MHVALLAPPWLPVPPPRYGGTEAVIDRLARGLVAAGHDVLLCATGDSTCPVPRHSLHAQALTQHIGAILPELDQVVDAREAAAGADVVHDHTVMGGLLAPMYPSQPTVVTHHGPFDAAFRRLFSAVAGVADVVAISAAQARDADPGTVSRVIHHGIDVGSVPVGRGDGGYLAVLGRMTPAKGIAEAIDVARRVGVPLRIAAKCQEPLERAYFEEVVRPQLGGGVAYLGELGPADKYELVGGAMALLNPLQWEEPFGLVMIEALATGTPVLSTNRGAAPEIVEHGRTGFLVDRSTDLVALVSEVQRLDRAACRSAAEHRFSSARMVADYVDLYRDVIDSARDREGRTLAASA
jgi:glycosyltransferase involved in cell wall biosynthesis